MAADVKEKMIKRKQQQTLIAFSLSYTCLGMEYGFSLLTIYFYLKQLLQNQQYEINIFYSAISVAYYLGSMLSSNVAGWLIANYQCTRLVFFLCHTYVILGNVAYSLPLFGVLSPYMLLAGRFLAGCGGGLRPLVSTTISKGFEEKDRNNAFVVTSIALGIGYVLAPLINFNFGGVDLTIGVWHITYVNVPAVFISWVVLFVTIFGLFMISDFSEKQPKSDEYKSIDDANATMESIGDKVSFVEDEGNDQIGGYLEKDITLQSTDHDLTRSMPSLAGESNEEADDTIKRESPISKQSSESEEDLAGESGEWLPIKRLIVMVKIICDVDPLLIITVTFLMKSIILVVDMWLPMLVADTLKADINYLNIIHSASSMFGLLALLYLCLRPPKPLLAYGISLISLLLVALMLTVIVVIKINPNHPVANMISLCVFAFSHAVVLVLGQVFLVYSLAALVPVGFRVTAEQVRQYMAGLAAMLGLIFAPALFEYAIEVSVTLIASTIVVIVYFCARQSDLRKPGSFKVI